MISGRKLHPLKIKLRLLFGSLDIAQRIRQKRLLSHLSRLSPDGKSILDAGCGSGAHALDLAYRYPLSEFVGMDSDMNRVEQAKADQKILGVKNCKFVCTDLTDPLGEGEYDIIYCIDVLEHIEKDELVIKNLCSVLKLGGSLLIHVPLLNQERYFNYFKNWVQDDHVREGYNLRCLIEMLENQNLQVVTKRYTFGRAGAIAWEIYEICRCLGSITRIFVFPFLALLASIDLKVEQKGNAILIGAKKVH